MALIKLIWSMDTGAVYNLKNQLRGHSDNDTSSLASLVYSHDNTI